MRLEASFGQPSLQTADVGLQQFADDLVLPVDAVEKTPQGLSLASLRRDVVSRLPCLTTVARITWLTSRVFFGHPALGTSALPASYLAQRLERNLEVGVLSRLSLPQVRWGPRQGAVGYFFLGSSAGSTNVTPPGPVKLI